MDTIDTDTKAHDAATRLLADAEVNYPTYGTRHSTAVDLGDGRTATLRVTFDEHAGIGRWLKADGVSDEYHDDIFGTFAWRGTESRDGLPATHRPDGFDGRARVLDGDSRGDRWSGPVWWQPTDDDTDPEQTFRQVYAYMRGEWFYVVLQVTIGDRSDCLGSVEWDYPDDDGSHLVEQVAEMLDECGIGDDPFLPSFEEDVAPSFAALLVHVAGTLGAPLFAADLACKGANTRALNLMAGRWDDGDFEPRDFAATLRGLAGHYDNPKGN